MKKLENLISLEDFKSNWQAEKAKKTKRTDTGLDIVKEDVQEIIPEGVPEENLNDTDFNDVDQKIQKIKDSLGDLDEGYIDHIVDYLREVLLEMEQMGVVDDDFTDNLDDEYDDWILWIEAALDSPDFPEDAVNEILDIISNSEEYPNYSEEEEVQCPDCEGEGIDENGHACERCGGAGFVERPMDISPDE